MLYLITSSFHVNTEDGALGYVISRHYSDVAAEKALARYDKEHRKECACGGGQIIEVGRGDVRNGKFYGDLL